MSAETAFGWREYVRHEIAEIDTDLLRRRGSFDRYTEKQASNGNFRPMPVTSTYQGTFRAFNFPTYLVYETYDYNRTPDLPMKRIADCGFWDLADIQRSDKIRIILSNSTLRGEVISIVNAGTEWTPSWEILVDTKRGLFHWRQQKHGGRIERLPKKEAAV